MSSFLQLQGRVDCSWKNRTRPTSSSACSSPTVFAMKLQGDDQTSKKTKLPQQQQQQQRPPSAAALPIGTAPSSSSASSPSHAVGGASTSLTNFSYRSSLNLKWKSNQFSSTTPPPPQSATVVASSVSQPIIKQMKKTKTTQAPQNDTPGGNHKGGAFWRECKTEAFVKREAIFYNYLLTKSNARTSQRSSTQANADASVLLHSSLASAPDLEPPQVDQPSTFSLMWDVSRVAAASHLLGGDGTFFLRKEFMSDDGASGVLPPPRNLAESLEASQNIDLNASLSSSFCPSMAAPISIKHLLKLFGNERTYQAMSNDHTAARPSSSMSRSGTGSSTREKDDEDGSPDACMTTVGKRLHKAKSFLLTESYDCTFQEFLQHHSNLDAVQITEWCKQIAFQISEMHCAGVLHNNINTDSIALCSKKGDLHRWRDDDDDAEEDDDGDKVDDSCTDDDDEGETIKTMTIARQATQDTIAKISWLYCATMTDLQVIRGLRKQTLSQSRADPALNEFHTLTTASLPESWISLSKSFPSVLPPEWFSVTKILPSSSNLLSGSQQQQQTQLSPSLEDTTGGVSIATSNAVAPPTGSGGGSVGGSPTRGALRLRPIVTPSEKSDAYLFGKFLQQLYTNTMVEFNPQSVLSVSSYYLSKTSQASFGDCPSKMGKLYRIDEINSESLRHCIMAATMENVNVRWSMREIANHPFFWSVDTIVEFLKCVAEYSFPVNAKQTAQVRVSDEELSLKDAFKEISQRSQPQNTKKSNITAPELASLKGLSKQLSNWVVEPRVWMTNELDPWFEAVAAISRENGDIRTGFENLVYQQVEFLLEVYHYMRYTRPIKGICNGDPQKFFSLFINRMFPTLLMECVVMTLNEDDAPKFARFVASKMRLGAVTNKRAAAAMRWTAPHLRIILSAAESFASDKGKTIQAAGYDHIVQYVGAFPQFPVHIPESEKVQVVKKAVNKPRSKPSLARLPKWAQEQIAASEF